MTNDASAEEMLVTVLRRLLDASTEGFENDRLILRTLDHILVEQRRQAVELALLTGRLSEMLAEINA